MVPTPSASHRAVPGGGIRPPGLGCGHGLARPGNGPLGAPRGRPGALQGGTVGMKLTLDLHDIYNRGGDIDRALRDVMDEAVSKKAKLVEIIPGKGSGQLKKRVLRFLDRKDIKAQYHRVEKDSHNFGRVFVHFRWKDGRPY